MDKNDPLNIKLPPFVLGLILSLFIMMIGMMIGVSKAEKYHWDKLKVFGFKDSVKMNVYKINVYNGIFEINNIYNFSGPYYKKGSKYMYTEFYSPNLDSIIKVENSNKFVFVFKNKSRDTVYFQQTEEPKHFLLKWFD
jgi:hypothetical protein